MMIFKRKLRSSVLLVLTGLVVMGLASCVLPASKGPQTTSTSNGGFPVPGNTQTTGGIDISTFATQTAQAIPPVASDTPEVPLATSTSPAPVATRTSSVPTSTQAPVTYVTATPGGPPETYTLQQGEFLFCIARRFDVSLDELLTLNNLDPDSLLSPGEELKIPQTGNPFEGQRSLHDHPTTYKIQEGDTLYKIACYFGDVSPDMIALQNGLKSYTDLPAGEVLVIP